MPGRYNYTVNDLLTTTDAAKILKRTPERVAKMCRDGILPSVRTGVQWIIRADDLAAFAQLERKPGRPRKDAAR